MVRFMQAQTSRFFRHLFNGRCFIVPGRDVQPSYGCSIRLKHSPQHGHDECRLCGEPHGCVVDEMGNTTTVRLKPFVKKKCKFPKESEDLIVEPISNRSHPLAVISTPCLLVGIMFFQMLNRTLLG
jgi:hypothetical protein